MIASSMPIVPADWNNLVVGVLSPQYTTNCDKGVFEVAQNSEQSLTQVGQCWENSDGLSKRLAYLGQQEKQSFKSANIFVA